MFTSLQISLNIFRPRTFVRGCNLSWHRPNPTVGRELGSRIEGYSANYRRMHPLGCLRDHRPEGEAAGMTVVVTAAGVVVEGCC
jgi:hypothetical protein